MPFLNDVLAVTEAGAGAFWVGASAGFAFVSAPTVAHEARDLDLQARITGASLVTLSRATYVAGAVAATCALARAALDESERPNDVLRACADAGALALVAYHEGTIVPEMTALQRAMGGSFSAVPHDDPARVAYRAVHKRSTQAFGGALLLGIVALGLAAARRSA